MYPLVLLYSFTWDLEFCLIVIINMNLDQVMAIDLHSPG